MKSVSHVFVSAIPVKKARKTGGFILARLRWVDYCSSVFWHVNLRVITGFVSVRNQWLLYNEITNISSSIM